MKDIFYTHRRQICSDLGNMDEPDRVGSVDFTIWVSISSLKQQAKFKINCIKDPSKVTYYSNIRMICLGSSNAS